MNRNIHRKILVLESLFKRRCRPSVLNFIKKRLQHRCFPVNIAKNKYFEEHLRTAASDCRLHLQLRGTFACWTGRNGVRYNYVLYLFVSFWYYYTFILSRSSRTEVFLKKVFLKIVQNSLENTCIGIFFFNATSNFNEEAPAQCIPKSLTICTKSFIVDVRLGYKYASVLPPDLKPIYKDFLLWQSVIKIATVLYSSNCKFREALIALAIGLINVIRFFTQQSVSFLLPLSF